MTERTRTIDVRAVQKRPVLGDIEQNLDVVVSSLRAAAADGIDLVVYPELFLTGYHVGGMGSDPNAHGEKPGSGDRPPSLRTLREEIDDALARIAEHTTDLTAVLGTPFFEAGNVYNSAVIFDSGSMAGVYHKTHLYGEEASVFRPGADLPTVETSAGTLGVEICYDLEFPEVARQLTLRNADVLVTISANMRPFAHDQRTYSAARALENVRPHVLCNRIGEERGVEFFGGSRILDERGRPVTTADEDAAAEITGSIDLRAEGADTLQYLEDRRPALYERS